MNVCDISFGGNLRKDSWLEGVLFLLSMNLEGMEVLCPKCQQVGMPMSKWIKGPKIKPIYVFHRNGRDLLEYCALTESQAEQVRTHVNLYEADVRSLLSRTSAYVLFSGGTDSLCTLHYVNTIALQVGGKITAIYADTTAGFPEVTSYVKEICAELEIDLEIVRPELDFFSLAEKWGIPGINSRWCCRELKIRPIADFLAQVEEPKIVLDGIRAVESSIRAKYLPVWFHPSFNCLSVSPIFCWSDGDVRSYLGEKSLKLGPTSDLGTSGECWCGAYKGRADFEELYHSHPEIYCKLMELEDKNTHGYTFVYENGQRISLRELRREVEREEIPNG